MSKAQWVELHYFKTDENASVDNTLGSIHEYGYGSWVWKPELELKADIKYVIYELNNQCFIKEYDVVEKTHRIGTDFKSFLKAVPSLKEVDDSYHSKNDTLDLTQSQGGRK